MWVDWVALGGCWASGDVVHVDVTKDSLDHFLAFLGLVPVVAFAGLAMLAMPRLETRWPSRVCELV